MRRFLGIAGRNLITVVLTVFVSVAFFSINSFAARTTVSVTNNTPYPLMAVYKAVGCVKIYHFDANQTDFVCDVKDVAPGATVSYEFGGGTSGRKVWAAIVSGTPVPPVSGPEMMISTDQDAINHWNSEYAGKSAVIGTGYSDPYDLTDRNANSCAVSGFGILHDAHVTWTKLEVQKVALVPPEVDPAITLFIADCSGVTAQPGAEFVSIGECETLVPNRTIDSNLTFLQQVVGVLADNCSANAKNHGQVVSCITQGLNTLVKDNLITGEEKGALTACAAHAREGY